MTTTADLLADAFGRIAESTAAVLDGLGREQLRHRPAPDANPIGWLVWHLVRVQDDHVADAAGMEQVWTADGWHERLGVPFGPDATGYEQGSHEVGAVDVDPDDLLGYAQAVFAATLGWVATLSDDDLDLIVDDAWDPPVTAAVRLVSVISDDLQHLGQAAYVRGLLPRQEDRRIPGPLQE